MPKKNKKNAAENSSSFTPDDLFCVLAALFDEWVYSLPERGGDGKEPLRRYARATGLPETSPLCMMFLAYGEGFVKGFETSDKLEKMGGAEIA